MEKLISIGDLFAKSFEIYKPRIWTMVFLGLLEVATVIIVAFLFGLTGAIGFILSRKALVVVSLWIALFSLIGILIIVTVILWIKVAFMFVIKEESPQRSVKSALIAAKNKITSYYWVALLNALAVIGGFILFIIPGIIFSIWFCLSQYIFIFEDVKGAKALSQSKELVKGYWWPVFGRLLLLTIIACLVSSISKVGFLINFLFTMPFGMIYLYIIYQDLKRIKNQPKI